MSIASFMLPAYECQEHPWKTQFSSKNTVAVCLKPHSVYKSHPSGGVQPFYVFLFAETLDGRSAMVEQSLPFIRWPASLTPVSWRDFHTLLAGREMKGRCHRASRASTHDIIRHINLPEISVSLFHSYVKQHMNNIVPYVKYRKEAVVQHKPKNKDE